ncbi:MAG: hypothetical protein JSW61_05340 [Candidatus Thorarchaeota archaeon]|nr:MAG: hypothetical protein JSW61_05340 [Candidatus Thorarchaeota archaeon]
MAIFRADHYLVAEFEQLDLRSDGPKVLDALKMLTELKDLAMVTKKLEDKSWLEILGRIDVPAGSKAFWAMIKRDTTDREPYQLFVRFDMNAEGETIDEARKNVREWIEGKVIPEITSKIPVKTIRVAEPNELYMPDLC